MIQPPSAQGMALFWAVLAGIGLGVFYDLGRGLRQTLHQLTVPMDLLFSLCFLLSLMALSLYTGGLRIYQCLGIISGGGLYFLTLSPPLLWLWRRFLDVFSALFRKFRKQCKKKCDFFAKT